MTMTITLDDLYEVGACSDQRRLFSRYFGEQVVATVTTAVKYADDFDWEWAASAFLRGPYWTAWETERDGWAWETYLDGGGRVPGWAYQLHNRFRAAAFAKALLAQGGVVRDPKRRAR